MDTGLSLQKITSLWQFAANPSERPGAGTPLSDAVFSLDIDDDGRAFFTFKNKKGSPCPLDEILPENTPLGTALARIKQQRLDTLSWDADDDTCIYLDRHSEFTHQLFKSGRDFLFKDGLVSFAETEEDAKIALAVTLPDTAGQNAPVELALILRTEQEVLSNPVPLTPRYTLCGTKIYHTKDTGVHYNHLCSFIGSIPKNEANSCLSIFASLFPDVGLRIEGWKTRDHAAAKAEPALNFRELDEEGNLSLTMLWNYEDFPTEFISETKPSYIIRLNNEDKAVERTAVIYDEQNGWKQMTSMLKSCLNRHPDCKDEQAEPFVIEDGTLYITGKLALPFLSESLGELTQNYRLFGTESISRYKLRQVTPKTNLRIGSGIDFFDTECTVDLDGELFSPAKFVALYEKNQFIPLNDGSRAIIDKNYFLRLKRLLGKQQKDGTYKISFFDLPLVDFLINAKVENSSGTAAQTPWQEFFSGFNTISQNPLPPVPVAEKLRDYQKYGTQWLQYLTSHNLGACLADDMGLGKTIQTITLLAAAYNAGAAGASIVIVPKSLIDNWISELRAFAPELDVYAYYGTERDAAELQKHQIILTTYAVARNDIKSLQKEQFEYAVLDEVQQIKNTQSQSSKAVMLLNAKHRVALSGTPMENNLGELYSIFRFLNPAMFGTEAEFNRRYGNPIQKDGDEDTAHELSAKIRPFILRRLKQDVAKELPDRTEQVLYVDMDTEQAKLYEQQRRFYQQMIEGEIAKNGFEKSQFCILQGLLELRQIATVPETKTDGAVESAKWETLISTISELAESGHRCLVFSNFLASLDAVSERLHKEGIEHLVMTGATSNRAELVRKFQQDDTYKVFLMTLKTGGVGLNLTGADYVFILDPWWNRSAEQQAIDRTHRIGQTRNVFCYRLIARNTIEEKILELQKQKTDLFSAVISSDGQQMKKLTQEDIDYLLKGN